MSYEAEYKQKLVNAEEAVKVIKSGDLVDYGFFNGKPVACDEALAARGPELSDINIFAAVTVPPVPHVCMNPQAFTYNDFQWSQLTRMMAKQSPAVFYVPILYHIAPGLLRGKVPPERNVGIIRVAPMDKHGWFNLGPQNSEVKAKMERDDVVIVEVLQSMPVCLGGAEEAIHISEVDYVVEAPENHGVFAAPALPQPTEEDKTIANSLMGHIHDGCCIQLGIGGLPNMVGQLIADSDLKDLGGHTEMFCDSYVDMIESGRMTGRRKTFDRGRVAYTFALGTQRMYEFMHNNPSIASYNVDYTNDPRVIAGHDNMISICNALQVDLYGQVNAESMGASQISGNGGMWDFVLGSQWSKGGKSFICLHSTFTNSKGERFSRIRPTFDPGTITTIPRQMVDYLVTEYGVAKMHGLPTWRRAEEIIGLAHPDYREELIQAAQKQGIWRQSNKRG